MLRLRERGLRVQRGGHAAKADEEYRGDGGCVGGGRVGVLNRKENTACIDFITMLY